MGKVGEHDVVAHWREPYRAVCWNAEAVLELAHLHDAVFRLHFMDLDGGEIRRAAGQTVGRRALVLDRHIRAPDFGALWGRARPGLLDDNVASLELLRKRGRGAECESERQGEKRGMPHCLSFPVMASR